MRIGFFGAAGEVTGSCTLVEVSNVRFLVDCGMFQGGPEARSKNLHALNFVAHGALGGGVSRSLSVDNYGKALSAAILGFELLVPAALAPLLRRRAPG